jgi:F0F1-type ATP synthase membrane subunit c/vacuolar-type H+-ATPase subunit K
MLGMGLLLVAVLWGALSQGYILAARIDGVAYPPALASKTTMANLVGSVFYYASLVFILLAILADRRRAGANTTQMDERTDGQAR